jgi:hypothetical protein
MIYNDISSLSLKEEALRVSNAFANAEQMLD